MIWHGDVKRAPTPEYPAQRAQEIQRATNVLEHIHQGHCIVLASHLLLQRFEIGVHANSARGGSLPRYRIRLNGVDIMTAVRRSKRQFAETAAEIEQPSPRRQQPVTLQAIEQLVSEGGRGVAVSVCHAGTVRVIKGPIGGSQLLVSRLRVQKPCTTGVTAVEPAPTPSSPLEGGFAAGQAGNGAGRSGHRSVG